jgi:hypothetical protein
LGVLLFQSISTYNNTSSAYDIGIKNANNTSSNKTSSQTIVDFQNSTIPLFNNYVNLPGANTYFIHTVRNLDQDNVIESMRLANIKLARVFIRTLGGNSEGSGSDPLSDFEVDKAGNYDESMLLPIDKLMYKTYMAGMKLVIALHDRWALGQCGDVYSLELGFTTASQCRNTTFAANPSEFYNNATIINRFDARIKAILSHRNPYFGNKPWSELHQAIHAIDIQNERKEKQFVHFELYLNLT